MAVSINDRTRDIRDRISVCLTARVISTRSCDRLADASLLVLSSYQSWWLITTLWSVVIEEEEFALQMRNK